MNEPFPLRPYILLAFSLLVATAACSSALGIDDAHLDPTFGVKANDRKATDVGNAGVCKPFDNRARLANLLPDGGLMPLPSR